MFFAVCIPTLLIFVCCLVVHPDVSENCSSPSVYRRYRFRVLFWGSLGRSLNHVLDRLYTDAADFCLLFWGSPGRFFDNVLDRLYTGVVEFRLLL